MRAAVQGGLEQARQVWWNGAIRGIWQGFGADLRHMNRYKGVPERVQLTLGAAAPARIIIKRRTGGFLNKPMTLFGPPLVDPMRFVGREHFWFRTEQPMLLETLLSSKGMAEALEANLIVSFDVVDIGPGRVKILRAVDDGRVRQHYGHSRFSWRSDPELADPVVAEEWKLAEAIAGSGILRRTE